MESPHGCRATLLDFMSYNNGETYGVDRVFEIEELGGVTASEVLAWFKFKCYGTPTPTNDARPTVRSNTLAFWKKALSYYMPNRNMQWNQLTNHGKPTRSQALNDLIKQVRRFEVRGQGAQSRARRPMREAEFRAAITELRSTDGEDDIVAKYGVPALMCFQFHMIGRVDDCAKWMNSNLSSHDVHPEKCGKARLAWSKKR